MNKNTAITTTVIIAVLIIGIIVWSLAMRSSNTTTDEYPANSPAPLLQGTPQEDISVDSTIDSDINTLEQELQGL